ncbi:Spo0B domain-containing protein [Paenibacillus ginsengarvi]|uniref:SpoOB alpha-helical domain-containing protein n=1 Tax=Paenibacillus ginsengarvi TaxID=400777 RepID=A0A3B0CHK4_9BACL|nr:Spo0B domain-containing protein [Paenibacillus ginsengarvi]RKN83839.1 hypothetical protein D7M11_16745 [Paenibacillus ginsengarvi]
MKPNAERYESDQANGQYGEQEQLFVQTINHLRHDWMNDVQVLYGYLKMKKYDKMHDYMEIVKEKMLQENCISKLGVPALILYLQSFRVRCRWVRLDVELESGFQLDMLTIDGRLVADTVIAVIETFVRKAVPNADGELNRILLQMGVREHLLVIGFHYTGGYDRKGLKQELVNLSLSCGIGRLIEGEATYEEDGAVVEIYMPLGT